MSELILELLALIRNSQKDTGEFETYARTSDGENFYIGESPFVTALIAYTLTDLKSDDVIGIVNKSLEFLISLRGGGHGLYKFWYSSTVNGTAFPNLPYDLDDTAVAGIALVLNGRDPSISPQLIKSNKDTKRGFYTWLQPSIKMLIQYPSLFPVFMKYVMFVPLFIKGKGGLRMAVFRDCETIVNMNVQALLSVMGSADTVHFPSGYEEIMTEMQKSLHYDNPCMYYLAYAKFIRHSAIIANGIEISIRRQMAIEMSMCNYQNVWCLLLCLKYLGLLAEHDRLTISKLIESKNDWINQGTNVCVGNKTFPVHHTYWSVDLTRSFALGVLYGAESN